MAAIRKKVKRYPTDLTDEEWALIEPLMPPAGRRGRPRKIDLREVVNARQCGSSRLAEQKPKRLYDSIAKGIVELDDLPGEQSAILKGKRKKAKAALERAIAGCRSRHHGRRQGHSRASCSTRSPAGRRRR